LEIYEAKLGADDANVAKTKNNLVNKRHLSVLLLLSYVYLILFGLFFVTLLPVFCIFPGEKTLLSGNGNIRK